MLAAPDLLLVLLLQGLAASSGIRTVELETPLKACNVLSSGSNLKTYRFQLEAQQYPDSPLSVAVEFERSSAPKLRIQWQRFYALSYNFQKQSVVWHSIRVRDNKQHTGHVIDLLNVESIAYSDRAGMCLLITQENETWHEFCGGLYLEEAKLVSKMRRRGAVHTGNTSDPRSRAHPAVQVMREKVGPTASLLVKGVADGFLGTGFPEVVGLKDYESKSDPSQLTMSRKIFEKLVCHPSFRRCGQDADGWERLVLKSRKCSSLDGNSKPSTVLPLLEDEQRQMAVKIECDSWSRRVNVDLLSSKGQSALLYKYHSSDVGEGISRVLKLPRTTGLEGILENEAKQVSLLQSLGVNVPNCNHCKVSFMGTDSQEHTTEGLVKELVYGFDLADVIAALGEGDKDFDEHCLPVRRHRANSAAVMRLAEFETTSWFTSAPAIHTFVDRIQGALRCIFARLAADLLVQQLPKGIFIDLSARNMMWATKSAEISKDGTLHARKDDFRLWLVDSMPILPGSREFHLVLDAGPLHAWEQYYAKSWNFGPGRCISSRWKQFEVPTDPAVVMRDWSKYCAK
mmetsp:Transcript_33719/g.61054  ORF Transcript_33719/g.61054 Transcript_33719/m.61054 type:complete len:570 (+) Transcript_33719:72-1781(+)